MGELSRKRRVRRDGRSTSMRKLVAEELENACATSLRMIDAWNELNCHLLLFSRIPRACEWTTLRNKRWFIERRETIASRTRGSVRRSCRKIGIKSVRIRITIALKDSLLCTCDKVSRLYRVTLINLNYTYDGNIVCKLEIRFVWTIR